MKRFTKYITVTFLLILLTGCTNTFAQQAAGYVDSAASRILDKDYFGALSFLNKAIAMDSANESAYLKRGDIRIQVKDYTGAEDDYSKAYSLDSSDIVLLASRASERAAQENWRGALEDYNRVIAVYPNIADFYNIRGLVKMEMLDSLGGLADIDKSLSLDSNLLEGYLSRASFYTAQNNYDEVLKDCKKMLRISPGNTDALLSYGIAEYNLQHYPLALQKFKEAITTDTTNAIAWYNCGLTQIALKNKKEGCRCLIKSDSLGYVEAEPLIRTDCKQ